MIKSNKKEMSLAEACDLPFNKILTKHLFDAVKVIGEEKRNIRRNTKDEQEMFKKVKPYNKRITDLLREEQMRLKGFCDF